MGILVFISYATKDAETFQISLIAEALTQCPEIKDVLYWQEDVYDDIYAYMNENVGKCDIFVLFCSPNALESIPVGKEWMAADAMNKPIIPVFTSSESIPPLLRSRLGIQIDPFNLQDNIKKLRKLILKKVPKVEMGIDLQFKLPKNLAETIHTEKSVPFMMPLLNFCLQNNVSAKNILITTEDGTRIDDGYFDESVSTVIGKFGKSFKVIIEKMQVIANFKVCMVGEEKSGKSKLLQYCVECNYDDEYSPTVGVDFYVKPYEYKSPEKHFEITLLLWDLGGSFDQFDEVQLGLFNETDGFIFVGDVTSKTSFEEIESNWIPNIRKKLEREVPFLLLANKSDLKPIVTKEYIRILSKKLEIDQVYFTSAKTGENIEDAFKALIALMLDEALKIL